MRTSFIGLLGLTLSTMLAVPALAQDAGPEHTEPDGPTYDTAPPSAFELSANVALVTDYRFRGVSLSDGDIAIQGGFDVKHSSGFYVGAWASSLEDSPRYGHTELDLYGGWSGEVASGITVDAGLLYYVYPNGDKAVGGPSDYFEPYASVSGQLGPVSATAGIAYAWGGQDALGGDDNTYLYLDLGSGIPNTPVSISAHAGYTDGVLSFDSDSTSWDFSLGASYAITGNLSAGVTYTTVEGPVVDDLTNDGFFATLSATF
ncbi:TorF family putative porin [Novosphingopyxis sp.]|uniref:TorF family putative porin n=1 Tax=Novosphingopyxis sp. TaxID=2709690 RepID=UPI003B5ABC06